MLQEFPKIIEIDARIFKYCGIILDHNWKRYTLIIPICILNILQCFFVYNERDNFTVFVLHAFYCVTIFNGTLRNILVIANRKQFEKLLSELKIFHDEIEESENCLIKNELIKATRNARRISIFNLSASFLDLIGAILYPLLGDERVHPFGVAFPGIDMYKFPNYEIIYLLQLATPIILTVLYMPFVNLFASISMFVVVALKNLQYKLRNLHITGLSEDQLYNSLTECIKYHKRIITYVEEFNSMVTYIIFAEFILFSGTLCALLFCLSIIETLAHQVTVLMYIVTMLYVLFTFYWQANDLLNESLKVSFAAYDLDWFTCSTRIKKALILIMIRSQQPLNIMIGNIYPMTLEKFQSILNASYTYFTVLKSVYK